MSEVASGNPGARRDEQGCWQECNRAPDRWKLENKEIERDRGVGTEGGRVGRDRLGLKSTQVDELGDDREHPTMSDQTR